MGGQILVFVKKQEECDYVLNELMKCRYSCMAVHAGMDQLDRDSVLQDFKTGMIDLVIATSVLARGLDVPDIRLVINYDAPNHLEDYVHRVGRTGRAGRKGTAYTFIRPDEDYYAPDIVKALTDSGTEVPADLRALSDQYEEKKNKGESVTVKGSGFGGKGFKFNEDEAYAKDEQKKIKKLYGVGHGESSSDDEDLFTKAQKEKEKKKGGPLAKVPKEIIDDVLKALPEGLNLENTIVRESFEEVAMQQQVSKSSMHDEQKRAALKAALFAAAFNIKARLCGVNSDGSVKTHFDYVFDINDYPQQARWKVTHKDTREQITEYTGAAITTRGVYVPPGTKIPLGERRLHLYIEGPSEMAVSTAIKEIKRILTEATAGALLRGADRPSGRYSVV